MTIYVQMLDVYSCAVSSHKQPKGTQSKCWQWPRGKAGAGCSLSILGTASLPAATDPHVLESALTGQMGNLGLIFTLPLQPVSL